LLLFPSLSLFLSLSRLLLPSIAETGAIRPPSTRRLLETTELVPVGISRRHFYVKMVARARGDAACERERLTSVANTVIEGVPGISQAKVVRCRERVKLTARILAFLTMDSLFHTPHFVGKLHTLKTLK